MAANPPSPRLPLEILLCIIEETARSSRRSLHNLALLSHGTLPFCQERLFNRLTLGWIKGGPPGEETRRICSIQDLFNRKPCVGGYVRFLVLDDPNLGEPACSAYATVLANLQNVHNFFFVSPRTWSAIPDHVESSILNIIQNPSLRSVHLKSIREVPPDLFFSSACANLTALRLSYVSFQRHNPNASGTAMSMEDSIPIPSLQSLAVDGGFSPTFVRLLALKWANGNPAVGLSHLRRCSLDWYLPDDVAATSGLMKIARNIEHLQLNVRHNCSLEGLSDMLAYGSVHTLKSMGLVFFFPAIFQDSLQELYRMSPTNVLEELVIEYSLHDVFGQPMAEINSVSVLGLLKVFTRARFPRLSLLALSLFVSPRESSRWREAAHPLEQVNLEPFKDTCAAVGIEFRFTI